MGGTRITTRAGSIALAAVLLVGAAACGDDDDGADARTEAEDAAAQEEQADAGSESGDEAGTTDGAGTGTDTCSLLQPVEFEAQFSEIGPVGEGVDAGTQGLDMCSWDAEDGMSGSFWLSAEPFPSGTSLEEAVQSLAVEEPIPVDGLGDEAYYEESVYDVIGNVTAKMYVRIGDTVVTLNAEVLVGESIQPQMTALAELAVGRL